MPTTVQEVLEELNDKEAVAKLSGLVTTVHADRLKPTQRKGQRGEQYWSAFLPVDIRADNKVCTVNINWPVSKDGVIEQPADLIRGGMELKVLSGSVSAGKEKPPDKGGGFWPNSVWAKLQDIRLDGAETPPGATISGQGVANPASGASGAPAASQGQARPSVPPKSQGQAVGFAAQSWDLLFATIGSGQSTPPDAAALAHLVGIMLNAYLQGRIE